MRRIQQAILEDKKYHKSILLDCIWYGTIHPHPLTKFTLRISVYSVMLYYSTHKTLILKEKQIRSQLEIINSQLKSFYIPSYDITK